MADPTDAVRDDASHLDATLDALDGGLTGLTLPAALAAIDGWTERIGDAESLSGVREGLVALRAALTAERLDGRAIGDVLIRLGAQTATAASTGDPRVAPRVARLGGLLESAGRLLSPGTSHTS